MTWPTFASDESPIDVLVKLSRFYGSDPEFMLAGGGNTSVKLGDRLLVKASGHALATIQADGFVELDRQALDALLRRELPTDRVQREEQFKNAILASRIAPEKNQRPSVEALLHHLMPGRFVVHSHNTLLNMFTCCTEGERILRQALGDDILWLDEIDPGFVLGKRLEQALRKHQASTGKPPRAVVMQNHGIVISGDSPDEVKQHTDWLVDQATALMQKAPAIEPFGATHQQMEDQGARRSLINTIAPALRGLLATGSVLKVVTFDDGEVVNQLVNGSEGKRIALAGPLTPDQIVYCRSMPLWVEVNTQVDASTMIEHLRQAIKSYRAQQGVDPVIVLAQGLGLFAVGDDFKAATTARLVYTDAIKIMAGAQRLGGVRYMSNDLRKFIEEWEVERYRQGIAAAGRSHGRASGKIAVVTGAAQGFGLEISQDLAEQGATVVLADLNVEGARLAADRINQRHDRPVAVGLPINVTSESSVADAIHQVVRLLGGFDVFISNAGVLRAGSVKTMSERDFDFVTAVNYKGYFLCVKHAAPVLTIQHQAKSDYFSDIIQINSKSGLQGSNRNGAYAGGKFGGIGLTQSFALELVEDNIKVNAICPGNFFDGPLWSDPENGLFAQYLRSGKVPGAKTIADVKKFYEEKVPMRRGCTTADVMKAVYYLMEQHYETGQAVPVTGGQVMLS